MRPPHKQMQLFRSGWSLAFGLGIILLALAGTIAWSTLHLRQQVREQIANRDGETLEALASMQYLDDKSTGDAAAPLVDPGEQFELVLKISRSLRNTIGVRLYSPRGGSVNAFPAHISEQRLPPEDLSRLRQLRPVSHFIPEYALEDLDLLAGTNQVHIPLLEVNIPLREDGSKQLLGVAQFLINGEGIAIQYAEMDKQLAWQAGQAFAAAGGLIAAGLVIAFQKLKRANRLLAERTATLLKANRELALAAKSSAVGAVTSHLLHGIRNPLAGLRNFVQEGVSGHGYDWELALASTERMTTLVNRVVRVLQERQVLAEYEISVPEIAEMLSARAKGTAEARGVSFRTETKAGGALSNHQADLVLLILENLVQNAIDATPSGKKVAVRLTNEVGNLCVEVADEGPGLPTEMLGRLFTPCVSCKPGGSGVGLAISQQLAKHLGGELSLKATSDQGCVFRLTLALDKTLSNLGSANDVAFVEI